MTGIHEDEPLSGFYRRRLVRGGPWVPAVIWMEPGDIDPETGELASDDTLCCFVNGRPVDVFKEWTWLAGNPISAEEYFALFAQSSAPSAPAANMPVDPLADAPVF